MNIHVANPMIGFNSIKVIIFSRFKCAPKYIIKSIHLFRILQILGCYNSTPLKMNLVLEIRMILTQKATGMFSSNPLLFPK